MSKKSQNRKSQKWVCVDLKRRISCGRVHRNALSAKNCCASFKVLFPTEASKFPRIPQDMTGETRSSIFETYPSTESTKGYTRKRAYTKKEKGKVTRDITVPAEVKAASETAEEGLKQGLGVFESLLKGVVDSSIAPVKRELEEKIRETSQMPPPEFIVNSTGKKLRKIDERPHSKFEQVLKMSQWRDADGHRLNIALIGPSGSGKTTLGSQVAKALDLPFYTLSLTSGTSEAKLLGRVAPSQEKQGLWEYLPPEFVKAYKEGGVWLGDEYDAADENMVLALNQPLSNGFLALPDCKDEPRIERHPDFIALVGMNTYGNGADRIYVGRNAQDGAAMDRWTCGTVEIDYDQNLEKALVNGLGIGNPQGWLDMCWEIRKRVRDKKLRRVISTRNIVNIAATWIAQGGCTLNQAREQLLIGWSKHEKDVALGKK